MKDFLGRDVTVGTKIFYSTTGRYPESRFGEVIGFTPSGIPRVRILKTNRGDYRVDEVVLVKNDFVNISI